MFLVPQPDQVRVGSVKCCSCHNNVPTYPPNKQREFIILEYPWCLIFKSSMCPRRPTAARRCAQCCTHRWSKAEMRKWQRIWCQVLGNVSVDEWCYGVADGSAFTARFFNLEVRCCEEVNEVFLWNIFDASHIHGDGWHMKTSRAAELQNVLSHSCLQCLQLGHLEKLWGCAQMCARMCSVFGEQTADISARRFAKLTPTGLACRIHWQVGWNGGNPPPIVTWHTIG